MHRVVVSRIRLMVSQGKTEDRILARPERSMLLASSRCTPICLAARKFQYEPRTRLRRRSCRDRWNRGPDLPRKTTQGAGA